MRNLNSLRTTVLHRFFTGCLCVFANIFLSFESLVSNQTMPLLPSRLSVASLSVTSFVDNASLFLYLSRAHCCLYVWNNLYKFMYTYTYAHMYNNTSYTYKIYMYVYKYVHTHTHTHIHTHTHSRRHDDTKRKPEKQRERDINRERERLRKRGQRGREREIQRVRELEEKI